MNFLSLIGLALIIAVLFCCPAYAAQDVQFRLDTDSLNLKKGIGSSIVVSTVNAQGAKVVSIDGLEGFDVISQSQSTSTSIVNNVVTYREDTYYTIMPKTAGQFTLKANIQYNGSSYETNELVVTVSEGSSDESASAQDIFIKTILSHNEAFFGEKVVVTYELYSRYSIENYGFIDYTAIDGVIAKDMPDNQLKAEYVYLDGIRYAKYEVRQLIIDPIRTGTYTIPSFNFQVNVITSNSMGGGFGGIFQSSAPMYLQTEAKELTVKPLPTEGKPKAFSGIVGELKLEGSYSREEMKYGDSFTLQAIASGSCNLDGLKNIVIGELPGFSVYETQKSTSETVENNRYHVQKAYEVILIPEQTGSLEVSPISVSYFNPVTEKYETAEIPGVTVEVLGDMPQQSVNTGGPAGNVETVTIDQVSYADTDDSYFSVQIKKEWVFFIIAGLVILIAAAVVFMWLLSNRKKQDRTLKSLYRQLMGSKDVNEVYNIFNTMIKHRYNLSLKASSQSMIKSSLPDAGLAAQIADIVDYMEFSGANDEKNHVQLKNKISGVYRMILQPR